MKDVSVIIPVRDESCECVNEIRSELKKLGAEVILVDDGSKVPVRNSIKLGNSFGYGFAIKTGILNCKEPYRPLVMTMDGDGQHIVSEAKKLYSAYKLSECPDMIVGIRNKSSDSRMRRLIRFFINTFASVVAGFWFADLNSGMRIIKRDVLIENWNLVCGQFSFTTTLTMSLVLSNRRIEFFPIKVNERTQGCSKIKLKHGLYNLYQILRVGLILRVRKLASIFRSLAKPSS
jgi:glycosyltransferase involved in cell wall biosynthesis